MEGRGRLWGCEEVEVERRGQVRWLVGVLWELVLYQELRDALELGCRRRALTSPPVARVSTLLLLRDNRFTYLPGSFAHSQAADALLAGDGFAIKGG